MMMGDDFDWRFRTNSRPDPKTAFKTFLRMSAKSDGLISNVIERLDPIWRMGGLETYPWKNAPAVPKAAVAEAARLISSREVAGVEIVPIGKLVYSGGSLIEASFQERLVAEIDRGSVCYSVGELLSIGFSGGSFERRFMENVKKHFLGALWKPTEETLRNSTEKVSRRHGVTLRWPALEMMMYYYICCGLLADKFGRSTMSRYEAALGLFGKGVILWGEERGKTGVWFALAG